MDARQLSKRKPPHQLPRPRLRPRSVDGRDRAISADVDTRRILRGNRGNRSGPSPSKRRRRLRKEEAVENVLELGAHLEVKPPFLAHPEVAAEAHRFGRLPLPAVVV